MQRTNMSSSAADAEKFARFSKSSIKDKATSAPVNWLSFITRPVFNSSWTLLRASSSRFFISIPPSLSMQAITSCCTRISGCNKAPSIISNWDVSPTSAIMETILRITYQGGFVLRHSSKTGRIVSPTWGMMPMSRNLSILSLLCMRRLRR